MQAVTRPFKVATDAYIENANTSSGFYRLAENIDRTAKALAYVAHTHFNRSFKVLSKSSKVFGSVCAVFDGVVGPLDHIQYLWQKNGLRKDVKEKNLMNLAVNAGYYSLDAACTLDLLSVLRVVNVGAFTGTAIPPLLVTAFSIDLAATAYGVIKNKEISNQDAREYIQKNPGRFNRFETKKVKSVLKSREIRETAVKVTKLALNILFYTAITVTAAPIAMSVSTSIILALGVAATFTALAHELMQTEAFRGWIETPVKND